MKHLILIAALLIPSIAMAEDQPPVWIMMLTLGKATFVSQYATETRCKEAKALVLKSSKKAEVGCVPVMVQ